MKFQIREIIHHCNDVDDDDDGDIDDAVSYNDDDFSKFSFFVFFLDHGISKVVAGYDLMPLPKHLVEKLPAQVVMFFSFEMLRVVFLVRKVWCRDIFPTVLAPLLELG